MNRERFFEILLSDKPSTLIYENEEEIFKIIPELKDCKEFNHPNLINNIYDHMLEVVDNVNKDIELRLAALFHDIGKPYTYTTDINGNLIFPNHWEKSKDIFIKYAHSIDLEEYLTSNVSNLIYYHDVDFNKSEKLVLDTVEAIGYDNITKLFDLKKADMLSSNKQLSLKRIDKYEK